ncbi:MAG TPA: hypothetical protein DDY98_04515 [Ruminococcaceae bacterium]|nr:hypothetical protein [Oscillospiraceae bacterium]
MPKWTDKQQQVIDTRDCSILVSASAGSGKTAVLVERILQQVLDEDPTKRCNIDDFLIVTFTNAAAAQMRQKITERLEKALEEKPEDEHILKQLVLVNHADISTIDSFCMHLVKEHFSLLKLDSVFNIGDEGMLTLVRMEVIDRLFEVKYKQENNETFLSLIDLFGKDYDDEGLKKAVLRIAKISNSFPQPETWIDNAKSALCVDNAEDFEKLEFIQRCCEMFKNTLHEVRSLVLENEKLVENEDGYEKVILTAKKDIEKIDGILAANSYHEIHARVSEKWATIGRPSKDTDDTLYNVFKSKREAYKKLYEKSNVFKTSVENILEEYKQLREYLLPLLELTEEYMALYAKEKEKRKQVEVILQAIEENIGKQRKKQQKKAHIDKSIERERRPYAVSFSDGDCHFLPRLAFSFLASLRLARKFFSSRRTEIGEENRQANAYLKA